MNPIQEVARRRLAVAATLGLLACAAVAARLVEAAVLDHERWVAEAERQQQRTVRLAPERGSFFDREGRDLAVSVPAWSAWADPSSFAGEGDRRRAARALASVIRLDEAEILRRLSQDRYFVWLERQLEPERHDDVAALGLSGVGFVKESRRAYPRRTQAAHLLGGVGLDGTGLEGLEYLHDARVSGRPGLLLTMRDARGSDFLPGGLSYQAPTRGADVVLTVDAVIQHVAERELAEAMARTGARAGTAILMFPHTGEVAALTDQPAYDPNNLPTHPSHLRTNRAVASCYEPGSTFKIFTVAAALEAGTVRPDTVIDCGGGAIRIGRTRIRDHHPYGDLTVREVLAKSSNVGAIRIGSSVGAGRLHAQLERFGFGSRTGIAFPGESSGILRDTREWSSLSLASISFGQEVAVSPIQLVTAAAAVANGGTWRPPSLVREIRQADGAVERPSPATGRRAISAATARTLTEMLQAVVTEGTGRRAAVAGYTVAGKTGTAQKIGPDGGYLDGRYVASFVGWVPARDPAFVALVLLDEPRAPTTGGAAAAPAFAAMARDVLRYLRVPPEEPGHQLSAPTGGLDAT